MLFLWKIYIKPLNRLAYQILVQLEDFLEASLLFGNLYLCL